MITWVDAFFLLFICFFSFFHSDLISNRHILISFATNYFYLCFFSVVHGITIHSSLPLSYLILSYLEFYDISDLIFIWSFVIHLFFIFHCLFIFFYLISFYLLYQQIGWYGYYHLSDPTGAPTIPFLGLSVADQGDEY